MTTTTEVKPDDFDAAFAEAIKGVDNVELASKATGAAAKAVADDTTAVGDAGVKADEDATAKVVADAAAKKAADDAAAAAALAVGETPEAKKAREDAEAKKLADDAAAKKAADDAAAAAAALASETPEAKKAREDAAAKKAADDAEAKKVADAAEAARKLAEEAARKVADEAAKKIADDAAAKKLADETAAKEIKDPVLADEQKKKLEHFGKEWADISEAVDIRVNHAMALIEARVARALATVVGQVYDHIQPLAKSYSGLEADGFRKNVLAVHKDYDDVYPKLESWIATQPAYLAEAYKRVYTDGNVQEVVDLVNRFKESTGVKSQSPAAPASQPSPAATAAKAAADAAAKKAAELAPVSGKRTTPLPTGADPEDFDGAFMEAAALLDPAKK